MTLFTSDILVTSDLDLARYLRKYPKAYNLIEKGKFIINYNKLLLLSTICKKKTKYAIVINTLHSSESQKGITGHWTVLLVERMSKFGSGKCIFIDSLLSSYKSNSSLRSIINRFCNMNELYLNVWNVKTQRLNSNYCGFGIIYFVWYFTKYGLKGIYKLKAMLKKYSLTEIENYILKRAYKLCIY